MIIGLDPGTDRSAWCELDRGSPQIFAIEGNWQVLDRLRGRAGAWIPLSDVLALEMVASYGMTVGKEVFETVRWLGRFQEAWERRGGTVQLVYRREVKVYHCADSRANDANIRQALIDRYGGKAAAIGLKATPGPCYGMKADQWSALALALTAANGTAIAP